MLTEHPIGDSIPEYIVQTCTEIIGLEAYFIFVRSLIYLNLTLKI